MALPTLEKTWQILPNQQVGVITGGLQEAVKHMLLGVKNRLIGVTLGAWTVTGSSDSSTANLSGTDLWVDKDDLVWNTAGNAHSWIVLRNTAIATNFEICIDLSQAASDFDNLTFVYSHTAGFTGGTITARPTATDEFVVGSATDWGVGDISSTAGSANVIYHIWNSTDGECTRVVFTHNRRVIGVWMFESLRNPVSGFTNDHVVIYSNSTGTTPISAGLYLNVRDAASEAANVSFARLPNGPTNTKVRLASEGTDQEPLVGKEQIMNLVELEWAFYPISVVSNTDPNKARLGEMYDVWFGSGGLNNLGGGTSALRNGILIPSNGTKQFAMFDSFVFPWDGSSIPIVS